MNPFFTNHPAFKRAYDGPLGAYVDLYATDLSKQGYSQQSARYQLRIITDLVDGSVSTTYWPKASIRP